MASEEKARSVLGSLLFNQNKIFKKLTA